MIFDRRSLAEGKTDPPRVGIVAFNGTEPVTVLDANGHTNPHIRTYLQHVVVCDMSLLTCRSYAYDPFAGSDCFGILRCHGAWPPGRRPSFWSDGCATQTTRSVFNLEFVPKTALTVRRASRSSSRWSARSRTSSGSSSSAQA